MSSQSRRVTTRGPVTRKPRVYRKMAPSRRGKSTNAGPLIADDSEGKLLLSNVGSDVEKTTIEEKFWYFGKVNKVVIHCNSNEAPTGTAEVWMSTSKEANKAKAKLNATDIFSDGRIIRIEKPNLLTKTSSFWKSVYKYVSLMNTQTSTPNVDSDGTLSKPEPCPPNISLNSD